MHTTATLFLYLIIFCIGAAIGGLIERALKRRSTPPPPVVIPIKNKLADEGDVEVFSAWRTRDNRGWLYMDGKRLDSKEALQPEQRQHLLSLVLDLRPWLETARPTSPVPEVAAQPVQPAAPELKVAMQPVQPEMKKSAPTGEEIKPAPVLESIIEQIDKVLQVKLATSAFKDRGIRLTEGPGGIAIIKDGVNRYEGIDAVPDPEIKTILRQAVAEWEKSAK